MERNSIIITNFGDLCIKTFADSFKQSSDAEESLLHTHAGFEFHLVLRGNFFLNTENEKVSLLENDCVLIFPDTSHKSQDVKGSDILSFSFFADKSDKTENANYYSMLSNKRNCEKGFEVIKQNALIADYMKKIISVINSGAPFSQETAEALIILLFVEIIGAFYNSDQMSGNTKVAMSENDSIIYRIEYYYNEYYMEDISLKKLSASLHLSEKQTNRIIKKTFGTDFTEHLRKIRLKNAQKLLKESDESIKDIAEKIGYKSYNGFYLAFKNKFGVTPEEYRKNSV